MSFSSSLPNSIPILDEGSLALVREAVREAAAGISMSTDDAERCSIVGTELCRNHLVHARLGEFLVIVVEREGVKGVQLTARDRGDGIRDPTAALRGETTAQGSMKQGLPAVRRFMDEIDVDVRWGEGTYVAARKFVGDPPYRSEVGVISRPYRGEPPSGDDALFVRRNGSLLVGVADGLGHGPEARLAAHRAIEALYNATSVDSPTNAILTSEHALAHDTRGAVIAFGALNSLSATLQFAGVGNISTTLHGAQTGCPQPFSTAGAIGVGRLPKRINEQMLPFAHGSCVVMHTDGLKRCDPSGLPAWQKQHPVTVAHYLVANFAVATDDALVLVAR